MKRKAAALLFGSLLLSVGINLCFIPYELMDGGLVGIALILNYLWQIKVGLALIVMSIPIFVWAWRRNRSFFYHSLHGMLVSSLVIDLTASIHSHVAGPGIGGLPFHPLVSAIGGGLLVGTGIGLMLRHRISTGGTDLLAQFVAEALSLNVGLVILMMDVVVIFVGALFIPGETLLLSTIAILAVAVATSLMTRKSSAGGP